MNITWKNCFRIGVSVFALFLCIFYWKQVSALLFKAVGSATPVFIGLGIAYVLNLLMGFYERHYFCKQNGKKWVDLSRRVVCLIGAIITLVGIISLIAYLIVPELVSCVTFLVSEIPPLINTLLASDWVRELVPADTLSALGTVDWSANISKILGFLGSGIGDAVTVVVSAVSSTISAIITAFISIIFSVYLLYGKDKLKMQGKRVISGFLPKKINEKIFHVLSVINNCFRRYIVGQCTEAVILGVLCFIGMLIFRFPYAGMISALIAFSSLVPVAGAYFGAIVGSIMILTESPLKALLFIVFIIVLQQLEGNFIYPKVVGDSVGLPAVWVLAAVTIGGGLFGVLGMLIGVPIVATAYRLIREALTKREDQKLE